MSERFAGMVRLTAEQVSEIVDTGQTVIHSVTDEQGRVGTLDPPVVVTVKDLLIRDSDFEKLLRSLKKMRDLDEKHHRG